MQKLIPPFLVIALGIVMIALHFLWPVRILVPQPFNFLGVLLIISGLALAKSVRNLFEKTVTEIHTFKQPGKLVTAGPFRYTRNPIYLGFAIVLAGLSIVLGSLMPIAGVLLFIIIADRWYIAFEEQNMERTFADEYRKYKRKVRRWV